MLVEAKPEQGGKGSSESHACTYLTPLYGHLLRDTGKKSMPPFFPSNDIEDVVLLCADFSDPMAWMQARRSWGSA